MVNVLMLMAVLACASAHAASLTAQLGRSAVALGEPLSLTVEARGLDLDMLDLSPLDSHFDVFARTRSRGTDSDSLRLVLYPRMAGAQRVPPLQLDSWRTAALPLRVAEGNENMPQVTASWALEPARPLVNQPVRLTLTICDDGSLQWQRPPLPTQGGRVLRVLGEEEGEGVHEGEACTLHRFHWALLATREGAGQLRVSMLDANRFGQRLRFPGPSLNFEAAALPAWLPAHVPPVAPSIQAGLLPARWPLNRPLDWRFEVAGGYSADGLKALLELQLRETPALGAYPPLIEVVTPDDDVNSPLSHYAVTLFWKPRASGAVTLPNLHLPWYDPVRGQMAGMTLAGKTLTVFDPRWQRIGGMVVWLAGGLLLAGLGWLIHRSMRWRLARRRGLHAIHRARDIPELAQALRQFSLSGQPPAPSLGEWQRQLARETGGADVAEGVGVLEQQLFGHAPPSLAASKQALLQGLGQVRPE